LETLRHARCNLVGAVLNRHARRSVKNRFPRWVEPCAASITLLAALNLGAEESRKPARITTVAVAQPAGAFAPLPAQVAAAPPSAAPTNLSFSVINPSQRAAWQQHLTLGPGDILTLGLYGQPELTRTEVQSAPDG